MSTPKELMFFGVLRDWMASQTDRLWIITPFIDKLGVSLLNSATDTLDTRLISRRNKELVNLKDEILLKLQPKIHVKLYIGDRDLFFGSANLNINSLMDNQEMMMKFSEDSVMRKSITYFGVLWA